MTDEKQLYIETGSAVPGAVESQMFGKPCFKVNGKAFCCFFENEMVFKLKGEAHTEALQLDGAKLFDPSGKGRAMKEWVQVPVAHAKQWLHYANSAAVYVRA